MKWRDIIKQEEKDETAKQDIKNKKFVIIFCSLQKIEKNSSKSLIKQNECC